MEKKPHGGNRERTVTPTHVAIPVDALTNLLYLIEAEAGNPETVEIYAFMTRQPMRVLEKMLEGMPDA